MKAVLFHSFDGPQAASVEEIADPAPGPGEVVIEVGAAALNFFDTLVIRNRYQFTPDLPFSPGGEVAGVVSAVGEGVEGVAAGDRVLAYTRWNGVRQKVSVPAADVIPVPGGVSDEVAASVTITYGTAMHGLKDRGQVRPGETVAVLGASGGAGLAAIEIAKLMGARVIAAASSPEKLEVCSAHGADDGIDYSCEDLKERLKALTDGKGVDVVYDCVGDRFSEPALRATAWNGRFLVVGFAAGDIPKIPMNLVLLKGCQIAGVFWSAFAGREPDKHRANIAQVLGWCAEGKLHPHIGRTFTLSETRDALELIDARKAEGKFVIRPQEV